MLPRKIVKLESLKWLEMHDKFCKCHAFVRVLPFEKGT